VANYADFKPTLMVAQIILLARKNLVGSGFCNTDIAAGLVRKGKKLTINVLADVSTVNTNEAVAMTYADGDATPYDLEITLDKTVTLKLRDSDATEIAADRTTLEAAYADLFFYALANDVDVLIAGEYANASLNDYETGTTPWQWGATATDVPTFLAHLHKTMDDAGLPNVPGKARFASLPNVAIQGLRLYTAGRATALGDQVALNGKVGSLMGFNIYQNGNSVSTGGVTHGIGGIEKEAIALAVRISPAIEKLRLEGFWADGLRARVTAGVKTYKPGESVDINLNDSLLA
jgi:hypothetical protein